MPSAVRHSVLRRVSLDVVVDVEGVLVESDAAVLSVELELGVFVALGVFSVDDGAGVVCVVVDSWTRVSSCTVRC